MYPPGIFGRLKSEGSGFGRLKIQPSEDFRYLRQNLGAADSARPKLGAPPVSCWHLHQIQIWMQWQAAAVMGRMDLLDFSPARHGVMNHAEEADPLPPCRGAIKGNPARGGYV